MVLTQFHFFTCSRGHAHLESVEAVCAVEEVLRLYDVDDGN